MGLLAPRGGGGRKSPEGPEGPLADEAEIELDPEQVHSAIEEDPARVAEAVAGELDFAAIVGGVGSRGRAFHR